ncbi:MAG: cadmium-translocating P-type ATPase [Bacteroides sp.]|nr:cadmium-translocating P-type ATPase [Bacteroides sp.]MCM1085333.1 cadmium-translocating P-type ATPase [Bacteroides sp.]
MESKEKAALARIITAGLLLGLSFIPLLPYWAGVLLCLTAYLVCGLEVLADAGKNLVKARFLDENFLMSVATIGALAIGQYPEAAAVMLFFQIGELFQNLAVGKSRASISSLMDIRPEFANLEDEEGNFTKVDPAQVPAGSTIIVMPGEKVPIDGVVVSGHSAIDTAALTGESLPRDVVPGMDVPGGSLNISGLLRIKTKTIYADSTVAKILDLVQNAQNGKAESEKFITRFARYYTPVVVGIAVLLAFIPPLFLGGLWVEWIHRALVFLVVSCPCALVISIPLTFFAGIGAASKRGILVKGSQYLENLSKIRTLVSDKTGTLTQGVFAVQGLYPVTPGDETRLLEQAALAESFSTHPIALGIREAYGQSLDTKRVADLENIEGEGVCATIDGHNVYVGNEKLMRRAGVDFYHKHPVGISIHVALSNTYLGYIVLSDRVKAESVQAVADVKKAGIERTVILSGDRYEVTNAVAHTLGIDECYAELLPHEKVQKVEEIRSKNGGLIAFVGDGINDAPVLKAADVGIAMGAMGSDAAIEAADVVIMDDNPAKVATAVRISKRTLRIVRQNIILSIGIKLCILILGAFGLADMWLAVFADVGVTIIAVLNAIRAMYLKKTI